MPRRGFDVECLRLRGDVAADFFTAVVETLMPRNVCMVMFLIGKLITDDIVRVFAFQLRPDRLLKVEGSLGVGTRSLPKPESTISPRFLFQGVERGAFGAHESATPHIIPDGLIWPFRASARAPALDIGGRARHYGPKQLYSTFKK